MVDSKMPGNPEPPRDELDPWAQWLLFDRHGGDSEAIERTTASLLPFRDRILDNARLEPSEVVLDVGCGDGLVGFGALARLGETGHVVFSDISQGLLDRCAFTAKSLGLEQRCSFIKTPAETLDRIPSESVDVITTRAVLAYVGEKLAALSAFFRVLKPGGRLSLMEPINQRSRDLNRDLLFGVDISRIKDVAAKIQAVYNESIMFNFNEYDLLWDLEAAGFNEILIHLEIRSDRGHGPLGSWEGILRMRPTPLAPTVGAVISSNLTPDEALQFERFMRPLVETSKSLTGRAVSAFITARKPINK